jgi:hypothetical protein
MEPTQASGAELVVHNGRLSGARRPLTGPVTVLGQGPGCEIRLSADNIHSAHCLLLLGPDGLSVRDLGSDAGTFINGERVAVAQLRDGDVLAVGAFQFRIALPPGALPGLPSLPGPQAETEAQRDALRVQVAAVAAQQAALSEDEEALQQQHSALARQQEQLASHLEEKRQELLQLAEQVQAARGALKREREDHERQAARRAEETARQEAEAEQQRKQVEHDRHRLHRLRRKLKGRFDRRVRIERQRAAKVQAAAATERARLERERQHVQIEHETLAQTRLRLNGDAELGKRQLQADWALLRQRQEEWRQLREQQEADLATRTRALRRGEDALTDAERALGDDRHAWESQRKLAEQELVGLETRIGNHRHKLLELQAALARAESHPDAAPPLAIPVVAVECLPIAEVVEARSVEEAHLRELESQVSRRAEMLEQVANELADQRLLLVEHWTHAAQAQQDWCDARTGAAADLEALTAGLPEREQALVARQEALEAAECALRQRQQELSNLRQHLEGWASRLRLRETTWERERDCLLADLRGRDELAAKQVRAVVDLRQRWAKRRRQEIELLRTERACCEKLRRECTVLRQEAWRRGLAAEETRRELAEKVLALEEVREQLVLRSPDAAATEGRIDRVRQRWTQEHAAAARETADHYRRLQEESAAMQQRGRELFRAADELAAREAALAQRQSAWEESLALAEAEQARLRQRLDSALVQRDRYDRQIAELRGEVERMARILLDEVDAAEAPLARAA